MGMKNLSDEELIAHLRLQGLEKDVAAADRIEQLVKEVAGWISNAYAALDWQRDAEYKLAAAEAKLERTIALLKKAQTYITDLEDHEGAEGFSVSTNNFASEYYAALTELEKTE